MGFVRRILAIVRATALEVLSEPLSLLVLLAALVLAVLAPAFHYHQFGEATRMARDAGFSALFTCGSVVAVFGTIRAIRGEIESGTLEMALAHPVSRIGFFLSKALGAAAAYLVFAAVVFLTTVTIVDGAAIGGEIAAVSGGLARLYGLRLAMGVGIIVLPLVVGAALNRFAGCRFVITAVFTALLCAAASAAVAVGHDARLAARMLPVVVLLVVLATVLLSAAAAFAVRFRAHAASAACGLVFAALLPAVGNYYLADALTGGGRVSWAYVGLAVLAAVPAVLLFLLLGVHFINGRDIT